MALTLNEARSQGRVGETLNGYLVALETDAETQALVRDINEAKYKDIYKNQMLKVDIIIVIIGVIIIAGFIYITVNPAIVEKMPFLTIIFNSVSCLFIFCVEILIRILMALRFRQLYGKN